MKPQNVAAAARRIVEGAPPAASRMLQTGAVTVVVGVLR